MDINNIVSNLFNTALDYQRRLETPTDMGDFTETFSTLVAGVPSTIQPIKVTEEPQDTGSEFLGTHKIYCNVTSFSFIPGANDRLTDTVTSTSYEIISVQKYVTPISEHHYKFIVKILEVTY